MPQAPYQAYPSVAPASEPTPKIGLSVPGTAFGTNIAEATRGFGQQLEHASDELSRTALQIQALQNDTWAKDKDADTMLKIGEKVEAFKQLEGQNAVNALPEHQATIKAIRDEALDSAPNAAAKRMLNASLARRVGFALVDAGGYAGTQAKVSLNNASEARKQASIESFDAEHPEMSEKTIKAEVRYQSDVHGALPEKHDEDVRRAISQGYMNSIRKMAPADPEKAEAVFNNVKDRLDPQVRDVLQDVVNRNMALKGSALIANRVMKDYDPTKGKGELEEYLKRGRDAVKDSDNPYLEDRVEERIRTKFAIGMAGYNNTQAKNLQTVQGYILGQNFEHAVVDMDGIVGPQAPTEVRAAFDSLDPTNQKKIFSSLRSASKIDVSLTPEGIKRIGELTTMATEQPDKFRQLTLTDENLPRSQILSLVKKQAAINSRQDPNSEINRYLRDAKVASILAVSGVVPSKTDEAKAETYNHFVGAFGQALDEYKTMHDGKGPNHADLVKLTQDLLQQIVTKPGYLWDTKERRFEASVPDEHQEAIKNSFQKQHGREPSEDEVRSIYLQAKHFPTVQ